MTIDATKPPKLPRPARPPLHKRIRNSDLWWSFKHSKVAIVGAVILAVLTLIRFSRR